MFKRCLGKGAFLKSTNSKMHVLNLTSKSEHKIGVHTIIYNIMRTICTIPIHNTGSLFQTILANMSVVLFVYVLYANINANILVFLWTFDSAP